MNVKHSGLATFAAALLLSATAFAADPHHGGGAAPHGGGGAPHAGGGAPHAGGGAPHGGGGVPHGGGGGFAHGGGGFSRGGGVASFSHAAPSHSFNRGIESHSEVRRNTATFRGSESGRGLEAPRGSTAATYTHAHGARGAYGGMEHATAATGGGPQHYARDPRGFGTRPSNYNNRPRNFDRGSYQRNASASARFHYGSYNAPGGYHYQRWTYGETLPPMYWARDYWLTSWWMFDLAIPPYGYEWVRYGDDALLINVYNGQILQVDYGVFY
jgi:Ni/Co efflux regulator RcnB